MGRERARTGSDLIGARALREWITGEPEAFSRVFMVESGASPTVVADVAGDDDAVLLAVDSGPWGGRAPSFRYSGALNEIGDALFLGERAVEVEDYVAAAFVQIIGPTVVGLFDEPSAQAFLDDAALARRTGVFPSALIDQRVLLANRRALVGPTGLGTPSAIRLSADGTVSIGVRGEPVGGVDELSELLTVPMPRAAMLGAATSGSAGPSDLTCRERIGRYLNATDLMKTMRLANGAAKIAGYGWCPGEDGRADAEPRMRDPFLLDTADGFVLADLTTLRRRLLSPTTATVVTAVQTSTTAELAADRVSRELDIDAVDARGLCLGAVDALDIHLGMPSDAACAAHGART